MNTVASFSIIVPVFNEEDNLPVLFAEIHKAVSGLGKTWEVLFVDDGSTDRSLDVIKRLAAEHPEARYVSFCCNCGQSAAFGAGFRYAKGDVVITIDADLQNDPADIPAMLREYERGFDMVIGWRARRQDTFTKRIASKIANAIRNRLSHETVKDTGCSLKVMRTELARRLPMFTGMHRFLPTLMKMEGASMSEMKVNHRPRLHGTSKYGTFSRAKTAFFDLLAIRWMQRRHVCVDVREHN